MPIPIEVKALDAYKLWIKYSDGVEGVVDLSDFAGKGVFVVWDDYSVFDNVHIGPSGEIVWSEGIDMCPDAMYLRITSKQPEEYLQERAARASREKYEAALAQVPDVEMEE